MSLRIATVVGARPQFVKAAPLSRALRERHAEVLIHTGQHYDYGMSGVFFVELGLPEPDVNLGIGSGAHGKQTGEMLGGIERVLIESAQPFDLVLVYGDTNSTLAGALAASKLHIPVAHVEAGLRSFNRRMPEEINRVVADHLSDLLFCPTRAAVENLAVEGITRGVHLVGDLMQETLQDEAADSAAVERTLGAFGLRPGEYVLATVHRAENTDDPHRLGQILAALGRLDQPVLLPLHPRTRAAIERHGLPQMAPNLRVVEPLAFGAMVAAESGAQTIVTDSGGVQKEARWLGRPCVTLRDETEWVETVADGWNTLVGTDPQRIVEAIQSARPPATAAAVGLQARPSHQIRDILEHWSTP